MAHFDPRVAHKEPHGYQVCEPRGDSGTDEPRVARSDPCVALCEPRVAHISKFSVESDLYMIHVWIIVIHV